MPVTVELHFISIIGYVTDKASDVHPFSCRLTCGSLLTLPCNSAFGCLSSSTGCYSKIFDSMVLVFIRFANIFTIIFPYILFLSTSYFGVSVTPLLDRLILPHSSLFLYHFLFSPFSRRLILDIFYY